MRCVTHCETIDVDLPVAWHRRGFRFVWACTKDVHLQLAGRRMFFEELRSLGVAFLSLAECIDVTTIRCL
jgi:hypothetical protein